MKIVTDISVTSRRHRRVGALPVSPPAWSPDLLFRSGAQGVWYDPSDLSTLFQNNAGTVPVTGDGDPVAVMLDKSGNGNHARQTVAAQRPRWRTNGVLAWLDFDGVDDRLTVGATPLGGASVMNVCAGMSYQPGGNQWGSLRSLVDTREWTGLTNPTNTGTTTKYGETLLLNGAPAPSTRKLLREALASRGILEAQNLPTAPFSGLPWQMFSYWLTPPPQGRVFGYVEYVGSAGPELIQLRQWMTNKI